MSSQIVLKFHVITPPTKSILRLLVCWSLQILKQGHCDKNYHEDHLYTTFARNENVHCILILLPKKKHRTSCLASWSRYSWSNLSKASIKSFLRPCSVCVCVCASEYVCVYMCECECVCVYMWVNVWEWMCVCVWRKYKQYKAAHQTTHSLQRHSLQTYKDTSYKVCTWHLQPSCQTQTSPQEQYSAVYWRTQTTIITYCIRERTLAALYTTYIHELTAMPSYLVYFRSQDLNLPVCGREMLGVQTAGLHTPTH